PSPADSGGDYTYSWTVPMGVSDPGNVASFSASIAGSYSVTITDKTTTACTGSGTGTLTLVPCCTSETAYAYGGSKANDFCGNIKSSNWGWSNGPYNASGLDVTLPLYAGASQCTIDSGTLVGNVRLYRDGDYINVVYTMMDDVANNEIYKLEGIHVYIGCDKYPRFAGIPGQYPYSGPVVDEYTATIRIPVSVLEGKGKNKDLCNFYFIGHANVDVCEGTRDPAPTITALESTQSIQAESLNVEVVENDVDVYPVPFSEVINVDYDLDYSSNVVIEIFDLGGNLLKTVQDSGVSKGSTTSIGVDFSIGANQMYIVRVTTDREVFVKQIVSSKK
ncbi:T9SS type A sorting domain-containing protein, partial [Salinimicrobium flavum]